MNILIPNATSPRNIGDLAILTGLLSVVGKNNSVKIHSTDHKLYKKIFKYEVDHTLYSWAVFSNRKIFHRIKNTLELLINYILVICGFRSLIFGKSSDLFREYFNADLILFVGGGYLRSQKGITQALNLLMLLLQFQIAKKSSAKKIVAPISFGPFAYKWQEKYAAKILNGFDLVSAREEFSHKLLKKNKVRNLISSSDTSFLLEFKKINNKKINNKEFILGFTIRKWLTNNEQEKFNNEFSNALISFKKEIRSVIQPIVQVDAPKYGDMDLIVTQKIIDKLRKNRIEVNKTIVIKDLNQAFKVYGKLDLLLGMRMHSNIISAIRNVPFVAIAYEHKTQGIVKQLGMEKYFVDINNYENKITPLLLSAYKRNQLIKKGLNRSVRQIRKTETSRWTSLLN